MTNEIRAWGRVGTGRSRGNSPPDGESLDPRPCRRRGFCGDPGAAPHPRSSGCSLSPRGGPGHAWDVAREDTRVGRAPSPPAFVMLKTPAVNRGPAAARPDGAVPPPARPPRSAPGGGQSPHRSLRSPPRLSATPPQSPAHLGQRLVPARPRRPRCCWNGSEPVRRKQRSSAPSRGAQVRGGRAKFRVSPRKQRRRL